MNHKGVVATVLVPGWFAPAYAAVELQVLLPDKIASSRKVTETASVNPHRCYEQALMHELGFAAAALGAIPAAASRFSIDVGSKLPEHTICADPVHWLADRDNGQLLPAESLDIDVAYATALMRSLNELVRPDGLVFNMGSPQRWFLSGMAADHLDTWPCHLVAHRNIAGLLPRHADAGAWRQLMTEVQMLLHTHPVNEDRQSRGLAPVNGLWFWGGCAYPERTGEKAVHLYTDDSFAEGLGSVAESTVLALDDADQLDDAIGYAANCASRLVILDSSVYLAWLAGDINGFKIAKNNINNRWLLPLQTALKQGRLTQLVLDGCEGEMIEFQPTSTFSGLWSSIKRFAGRTHVNN